MTAPQIAAPATTAGAAPRRFTVTLPVGIPLLNSNQRLHRHEYAKRTAAIRAAAVAACKRSPIHQACRAAAPDPLLHRAHILGVVHPPRRGRRDPANLYPSFKAAVDGLVDAGVFEDDDHTRVIGPDMRLGPVVKGGQLVLHLCELALGEEVDGR